jgi:hypothetical protein
MLIASGCRKMTAAPQPKQRKIFVIRDVPVTMVQRNANITKGAQHLWMNMKSMADHRTGELRHRQHWFTGKEIDRRAGICDETRKKYMRELVALGLVRMERVRVDRVLMDHVTGHRRRRTVLGETRYTVAKSPLKHSGSSTAKKMSPRKTRALLQPISSIVEEIGSQFLSETHQGVASGVHGQVHSTALARNQNHHPAPSDLKADDDPSFDVGERIGNLQDRAARELESQGHNREFVDLALSRIDERSTDAGTVPGSPAYYVHAFRTLLENERECAELTDELLRRRRLREKFLGTVNIVDLKPTTEQEERRKQFNESLISKVGAEVMR